MKDLIVILVSGGNTYSNENLNDSFGSRIPNLIFVIVYFGTNTKEAVFAFVFIKEGKSLFVKDQSVCVWSATPSPSPLPPH
jgi:hypothetical protein